MPNIEILVVRTRDDVGWADWQDVPAQKMLFDDVVAYLESDPSNAVFVLGPRPQYIVRGASGGLNNFYYGDLPAIDPNNAEGGDLMAEEALERTLQAK